METITLQANTRTQVGRKTYQMRGEGIVPAVLYGAGTPEPKSIAVNRKALAAAYKQAGESTLVDLVVDSGSAVKVLIQDLQVDPIYSEIIHADFRSVDMTKPITAEIKVHFIGEAPAVKELGGTFVEAKDTIEVKALPKDLVASIDVDISLLKTFEDTVRISSVVFPPGITPMDDGSITLALIEAPRSEEEMAELEKAVEIDVTAIEVAGKKEKEEEAAAEGEAEAPAAAGGKPEAKKPEGKSSKAGSGSAGK